MRKSTSGFTIIELIIVIVVIGIIVTISIVSYNGIQKQTLNTQRAAELLGWKATFEKYKAANGQYPVMTGEGYCLGTGFPSGKCRIYNSTTTNVYYESDSVALMQALAPYDPPAATTRVPVENTTIGPYVRYYSTTVELTASMTGVDESDCPQGSTKVWQNSPEDTRMLCAFILNK